MANPQKEDGFTPIAREILEAIQVRQFSARELAILMALWNDSYGWRRKETRPLSYQRLALLTHLQPNRVGKILMRLIAKGVLERATLPTFRVAATYRFVKNYDLWAVAIRSRPEVDEAHLGPWGRGARNGPPRGAQIGPVQGGPKRASEGGPKRALGEGPETGHPGGPQTHRHPPGNFNNGGQLRTPKHGTRSKTPLTPHSGALEEEEDFSLFARCSRQLQNLTGGAGVAKRDQATLLALVQRSEEAGDMDALWRHLAASVEEIRSRPVGRWPDQPVIVALNATGKALAQARASPPPVREPVHHAPADYRYPWETAQPNPPDDLWEEPKPCG